MKLTEFIALLASSGFITFLLGWLSGRKKNQAETDGKRIDNMDKAVKFYREIYDDLLKQLSSVSMKCSDLSKEISELREENISLKKDLHDLKEQLKSTKDEKKDS